MTEKNPTWGYRPDGSAKLFDLKAGEELPPGWSKTMPKGTHPHDVERGIMPDPVDPDGKPATGEYPGQKRNDPNEGAKQAAAAQQASQKKAG